jgi:hypothetical protein
MSCEVGMALFGVECGNCLCWCALLPQAPHYKLLTVSSHYNTQLGVVSALQAGAQPDARTQYPLLTKIPALASVLIFELHSSSNGQLFVRVVYQDGPRAPYKVLPLPCAKAGDAAEGFTGPGSCTLQSFRALAEPQAFYSSSEWCEACSNSKVMACVVRSMERQLAAVGIEPATGSSQGGSRRGLSPSEITLVCIAGAVFVALVAAGGFVVARKRHAKRGASMQQHIGYGLGVQQTQHALDRPAPV